MLCKELPRQRTMGKQIISFWHLLGVVELRGFLQEVLGLALSGQGSFYPSATWPARHPSVTGHQSVAGGSVILSSLPGLTLPVAGTSRTDQQPVKGYIKVSA
jgi:hypothetical protein